MRAMGQSKSLNTDKIYQRIGEFVVCYQWLENKFREIGWLILDPWAKRMASQTAAKRKQRRTF